MLLSCSVDQFFLIFSFKKGKMNYSDFYLLKIILQHFILLFVYSYFIIGTCILYAFSGIFIWHQLHMPEDILYKLVDKYLAYDLDLFLFNQVASMHLRRHIRWIQHQLDVVFASSRPSYYTDLKGYTLQLLIFWSLAKGDLCSSYFVV